MLSIQDVTYRIAGRTLLDRVSVNIPTGYRVGLVGPNGAGKSTLFKLIAGELQLDGGEISLLKGASLGMVRQDLPHDETSLLDVVLQADKERARLMKEAETTEDSDRISFIYERLTEIDAYEAPSRAASILAGLGFNEEAQGRPISDFSGGWRARVALASALFLQPNLLLLDEPTNHLDFESMVWLENFLIRYEHTLVVISHDRDILNKTVDHIIHLENQKLMSYTGNYDQFERRRAERLLNQQAMHEKQQAQKERMMKFVDRFRATASKARQAQSRLKAIEKMDIVDAVIADRGTHFTFPEPKEMKSPLIQLEHVDAGYVEGRPVLRGLDLRIDKDDRIALLGANGNGKSTLVKIISDRLKPMAGTIHKNGRLKVGYFAQFQTDELDVDLTPFQLMQEVMVDRSEPQIRAVLASFGFNRSKADTKVGALSGGEKARLLFCRMSFDAPHIMLLDEPTNHLDIDAREALIQALNEYTGAVILVSHDPHLVECVADQLWLVADGTCKPFEEDLEVYRKLVIRQRRMEREKDKSAKRGTSEKPAAVEQDNRASEKEAEKLEAQIIVLQKRKLDLEAEIALSYEEHAEASDLQHLNHTYEKVKKDLTHAEHALEKLIAGL
jgi:ATP-binding cassette subfamily F protein 3